MHEQEQYECFGVPSHVRIGEDGTPRPRLVGSTRRNWVFREAALLGAEAIPSPPLAVEPHE
jgi:hypothetical protein